MAISKPSVGHSRSNLIKLFYENINVTNRVAKFLEFCPREGLEIAIDYNGENSIAKKYIKVTAWFLNMSD